MAFYGTNPTGGYFKMTPQAAIPTFPGTYVAADKLGSLYFNSGTGTITAGLYVFQGTAFASITPSIDASGLTTGQLAEERGGVPIGGIITFAGPVAQAPVGYVLCDGATISGTGAYASLYSVIINYWGGTDASTMAVPDFRGYFLRGVTTDTGRDPDTASRTPQGTGTVSVVGSYQADEFDSHFHTTVGNVGSGTGPLGSMVATGGSFPRTMSDSTGGSETRPKNMYVNFYIKYIST
jgi:microcystin-dependent protein